MEDIIKELDAAVAEEETTPDIAEAHPEASEQAVANAKKLEELKTQVAAAAEAVIKKKKAKKQRKKALQREVRDVRLQVALMADQAGVANEEEKQLIEQAAAEAENTSAQAGGTDELATVFDPTTH